MSAVKRVLVVLAALAAVVTASLPLAALAQDAAMSPWSKGDHASLRLIAGATAPSGKQRVGVEILMAPGYKTYWRSPGDFGVPPVFDWSGSTNIGGLDVRWPTPERFEDGNGHSLGDVGEDGEFAETVEEGRIKQDGRAHVLREFVVGERGAERRVIDAHGAGGAVPRDLRALCRKERDELVEIGDVGDVEERHGLVGEERGAENGEDGVLVAGRRDGVNIDLRETSCVSLVSLPLLRD
eukprot:gene11232-15024_t